MSNPFDNKIKESLENFEMPYDATAWAEIADQLPPAGGAAAGSSQFGWKAVALIAIIATTVATAWYLTNDNETISEDAIAIEQPTHEDIQEAIDNAPSNTLEVASSEETVGVESSENTNAVKVMTSTEEKTTRHEEVSGAIQSPESSQPEKVNADHSSEVQTNHTERMSETPTKEDAPIVAKFLPSTFTVCVGEDVSFINESSDRSANMTWEFGDGNYGEEINPVHSYIQPGNYTVRLTADNGSKTSDHTVTVTVNPTPRPIFSAERKLNGYVAIPLYRVTTAVQPSETAVWSFSDGDRIVGNSAEHLFREAGTSTAKLTVTNPYGCSNTMEESYQTDDFNLIAPNTFSPNGDGINELFVPAALPEMGVAFEMTVTNPRTGAVVYRTSNSAEPWNGKMNNVDPTLETGVYILTVVVKENVVNHKGFNGKINLTR